jgi:hypothetical protein
MGLYAVYSISNSICPNTLQSTKSVNLYVTNESLRITTPIVMFRVPQNALNTEPLLAPEERPLCPA